MDTGKKKGYERKGRTTVDLYGEPLKQAIALRHKRERSEGVVVSLSETVRAAIQYVYEREIDAREDRNEQESD